MIKQAYIDTCDNVLGTASSKGKNWITSDTWKKIHERRDFKEKLDQAVTWQLKRQAQREYSEKDREIKGSCKKDKQDQQEYRSQLQLSLSEVIPMLCWPAPRKTSRVQLLSRTGYLQAAVTSDYFTGLAGAPGNDKYTAHLYSEFRLDSTVQRS